MSNVYKRVKGLVLSIMAVMAVFVAAFKAEASTLAPAQNLPDTGEEFAIWGIVLGAIIVAIVLVVLFLRRKKEKEEE